MNRIALVSMSGLRVGHEALLKQGLKLPGLAKRASALAQLPPLGLLTVAATVPKNGTPEGWEQLLICDIGSSAIDATVDEILSTNPDIVAFSSLTPAIDRAIAISGELRKRSIPTVVGGLHATAFPEGCTPYFDVTACGDGERLFPQILNDFRSAKLKPLYSADGSYSLDDAPLPRWDLLGNSAPPRYTLQTLRGCPWACSFCAASRLLGPPRAKSLPNIRRELKLIQSLANRPWIELADDNTFAVDRDYELFLDAFEQSGARWFTESDWRIASNDPLLRRLARSGCQQILIGIESSVFRYSGMGGKTATLDRMQEACVKIQEHGVVVNACFIIGAEGETSESIERLGSFLDQAPFGEIQLTLQTPFPGTSLYRNLKQQNRLLDKNFTRYTLFDVVYQPDGMSVQELERGFHQLISSVFSPSNEYRRGAIRKRIRRQARIS